MYHNLFCLNTSKVKKLLTRRKVAFCLKILKSMFKRGAGEIRETANLINRGNIFQEIREHFLRNTRIHIFFSCEWSKQMIFLSMALKQPMLIIGLIDSILVGGSNSSVINKRIEYDMRHLILSLQHI